MAKHDYILWDWNGTLLDDVDTGISVVNTMLAKRGMACLSGRDAYRDVFRFPVKDYYLEIGFDFSIESFEDLSTEYVKLYNSHPLKLFPDAKVVLETAQTLGLRQLILSASEKNHLKKHIEICGVAGFFEQHLTQDNIYAHGKTDVAAQWLKKSLVSPERVLIVGDTLHDWEVAKLLGCGCVLVNHGHQNLSSANSQVHIVESLSQAVSLF